MVCREQSPGKFPLPSNPPLDSASAVWHVLVFLLSKGRRGAEEGKAKHLSTFLLPKSALLSYSRLVVGGWWWLVQIFSNFKRKTLMLQKLCTKKYSFVLTTFCTVDRYWLFLKKIFFFANLHFVILFIHLLVAGVFVCLAHEWFVKKSSCLFWNQLSWIFSAYAAIPKSFSFEPEDIFRVKITGALPTVNSHVLKRSFFTEFISLFFVDPGLAVCGENGRDSIGSVAC